jgi:hypothetical protein
MRRINTCRKTDNSLTWYLLLANHRHVPIPPCLPHILVVAAVLIIIVVTVAASATAPAAVAVGGATAAALLPVPGLLAEGVNWRGGASSSTRSGGMRRPRPLRYGM